jgi:mono/diheme cytochrome c family protein
VPGPRYPLPVDLDRQRDGHRQRQRTALAERWCAECHVIAPGQQQASDAVPTFAQIGGRFDETALATFLASPHHSRMPNLSLSRSEIVDLVAYIKGLVR